MIGVEWCVHTLLRRRRVVAALRRRTDRRGFRPNNGLPVVANHNPPAHQPRSNNTKHYQGPRQNTFRMEMDSWQVCGLSEGWVYIPVDI